MEKTHKDYSKLFALKKAELMRALDHKGFIAETGGTERGITFSLSPLGQFGVYAEIDQKEIDYQVEIMTEEEQAELLQEAFEIENNI